MKKALFLGCCIVVIFAAYKREELPVRPFVISSAMSIDSLPGSSPHFTAGTSGNPVISWVRHVTDSTAVLCYSYLKNGEVIEVTPSTNIHPHGENIPKVIVKPSGEVIAIWGADNPRAANKYSGLVYYAQSFDNGKTWSDALPLVKDSAGDDQRYFDVALMNNGEVAIIWLDNRTTSGMDGSALYMAQTSGNNGFVQEKIVSEPACQCCRTKLYADTKGNLHAVYRGIIQDSIRDMVHVISEDGGQTFSAPERIHHDNWVLRGCPHTGPAMTENAAGLHFAWFTGGLTKGSFYIRTGNNGRSFNAYSSISEKGTHPQLASLADGKIVVVWDETVRKEDKLYKRIGMQVRTAEGFEPVDQYITEDTSFASYPVLFPTGSREMSVAYTVKANGKEYIRWKNVTINR